MSDKSCFLVPYITHTLVILEIMQQIVEKVIYVVSNGSSKMESDRENWEYLTQNDSKPFRAAAVGSQGSLLDAHLFVLKETIGVTPSLLSKELVDMVGNIALNSDIGAGDDYNEDFDFSDTVLSYINQMLMEEDMEDKTYASRVVRTSRQREEKRGESGYAAAQTEKRDEGQTSPIGPRGRKNPHRDDKDLEETLSRKQAAVYTESTVRSEEFDVILLHSMGNGKEALTAYRESLKNARMKTAAVADDDCRSATELLKQIRLHSSPFGDGNQRLTHCFADGLEVRLAGTSSQIYKALVNKKTSAADFLKASHLYLASCPFRKISGFASNKAIITKAGNATRVHVIDFGILYGFQWPTLIQRIAAREGGPPHLRITGIEFPQPGFRPAERIEETGWRLTDYAKFKNLHDETVLTDSSRTLILNLIREINPDIFIRGIVNGAYSAPFFVTRFREVLFHFSALFDMLEANVPREFPERMLIEREIFGREALNDIACEGWERVERPETHKQWQVRHLRARFRQIPFDQQEIMDSAVEKVSCELILLSKLIVLLNIQ
ncbi:hypothetical protein K7X08_007145 [Anisodus acutangulus]|uniref:Scarecrow-like protein 9 n=1 Tax=Anisodus acutangulus TaxID=402998 RepID=A0A9Q1QZ73_9SOLA|nr:hypothetical protein K7X08_007145 [Anisodus acutangulus]